MGFWSDTFGGGNSFGESVANTFTPNDGYSYERGDLVNDSTGLVLTPEQKTAAGKGSADNSDTNRGAYERSLGNVTLAGTNDNGSSTDRPVTGIQSLLPVLGGMALGPVGVAAGLAYNRYGVPQAGSQPTSNNGNTVAANNKLSPDAALLNYADRYNVPSITKKELDKARESGNRIQGSFYKDGDTSKQFKMNMFGNSYEVDTDGQNAGNSTLIREQAAAAGGEGGIAAVRPVGTQATVATSGLAAPSAMSLEAAAGENMPIPDPNYDPTDPMSQKYIVNPTYEQIVAYKKTVAGMARGGEVESALGGNEKDLINDAEKAIRGELDETRASIILAQYVQQYGEDALRDLVDSIRTGKADDTRERFARGDNGMVLGNGDGSGVDDKVTAQLKDGDATQDVLLADGEFVMRKDATDSLQKAYGGGMLDKINDAGPDAAATLKKYMTA